MSHVNVEIVRNGFEAWDRRDYDAATSHFSPVVEIDASDRVLNPAVYSGLDGAMRFRDEIAETWDEFHVEVEDVVSAGDDVVVLVRSSGRGRASGAEVESRAAWVATVRDQRIARLRLYRDRSRALEAVGLLE
jgi:ketosteroid isomerase-like protein